MEAIRRQVEADPADIDAQIALLVARSRLEGPNVYFECLGDHKTWNKTPPQVQDAAIEEVARRLSGKFKHKYTRVWSCENGTKICEECGGSGRLFVIGGHTVSSNYLQKRDLIEMMYPHVACDCEAKYGRFNGGKIPVYVEHRLATFVHVDVDLELNLLPGAQPIDFLITKNFIDGWTAIVGDLPNTHIAGMPEVGDNIRLGKIIKPFLVSRWPVTNRLTSTKFYLEKYPEVVDLPTTNLHRPSCLKRLLNRGMRFLTTREWKYACKAGTSTRYYWGDSFDPTHVWNHDNSGGCSHCFDNPSIPADNYCVNCGYGRTWDSLSKKPPKLHDDSQKWNAFGLVDMIGNVEEYVQEEGIALGGGYLNSVQDFMQNNLPWEADAEVYRPRREIGFRAACDVPD